MKLPCPSELYVTVTNSTHLLVGIFVGAVLCAAWQARARMRVKR